MKRKFFSLCLITALTLRVCSVAIADYTSPSATRSGLKSSGAIVYQAGDESVVIDSKDLYVLADKLDSFKTTVVEQLAAMHTYLTTEDKGVSFVTDDKIHVTHVQAEGMQTIDPLLLDFDTLLEGFAASQSVPSKVEEYGYSPETQFYKKNDGSLTTDPTGAGTEQINITASTADNLSAGCAAWVDGKLMLGTGADNRTLYNLGYADGYSAKINGAYISYNYHKHVNGKNEVVGQSTVYGTSSPGGCYRSAGHEHNRTASCPSHIEPVDFTHEHWVAGTWGDNIWCPHCGFCSTFEVGANGRMHHCVFYGERRVYTCGYPTNTWTVGCGKTTSTIESANIVFP